MSQNRGYPDLNTLLGQPADAILEIRTVRDGWAWIENAAAHNEKASFEGLCHVVFRQLVTSELRAHEETRLAELLGNPRVHHQEAYQMLENILKKTSKDAPLSLSIRQMLDAFSDKNIQERLLALSPVAANKSQRASRPQQPVRPGPNRLRTTFQRI